MINPMKNSPGYSSERDPYEKPTPPPAPRVRGHKERSYCPECGHQVQSEDRFCSNCGHSLVPTRKTKKNRCDCGNTFGAKDKFCRSCRRPRDKK